MLIQTFPVSRGTQVLHLRRDESEDDFGFDKHCGQASCFENKYQTFDMTFIFLNVSALPLLQ
jgi:hypothetical protein